MAEDPYSSLPAEPAVGHVFTSAPFSYALSDFFGAASFTAIHIDGWLFAFTFFSINGVSDSEPEMAFSFVAMDSFGLF